jgi:hypothetical protein
MDWKEYASCCFADTTANTGSQQSPLGNLFPRVPGGGFIGCSQNSVLELVQIWNAQSGWQQTVSLPPLWNHYALYCPQSEADAVTGLARILRPFSNAFKLRGQVEKVLSGSQI